MADRGAGTGRHDCRLHGCALLFPRSSVMVAQSEKKARLFDKTLEEWKKKFTDSQAELEQLGAESRSQSAQIYQLKAQLDQGNDSMEALRKENKNLAGKHLRH